MHSKRHSSDINLEVIDLLNVLADESNHTRHTEDTTAAQGSAEAKEDNHEDENDKMFTMHCGDLSIAPYITLFNCFQHETLIRASLCNKP